MTADIHKVGGVLVRDRQLLVVRPRGKPHFIAPGGKVEAGETPRQALVRELREELDVAVAEEDMAEFGSFQAPAASDPTLSLHMDVFTVSAWRGEPVASAEIDDLRWVTTESAVGLDIGSVFAHEVIPHLKKLGLID